MAAKKATITKKASAKKQPVKVTRKRKVKDIPVPVPLLPASINVTSVKTGDNVSLPLSGNNLDSVLAWLAAQKTTTTAIERDGANILANFQAEAPSFTPEGTFNLKPNEVLTRSSALLERVEFYNTTLSELGNLLNSLNQVIGRFYGEDQIIDTTPFSPTLSNAPVFGQFDILNKVLRDYTDQLAKLVDAADKYI